MEDQVDEFYEKNGYKYPFGCIEVLNCGFVRLVDKMGDDSSIVQAARVSYGKGTKKLSEDEALIRYLMRHGHTTPFEMVQFKFQIKAPIFVFRQWHRHRTWSFNEYSGRYSEMPDQYYVPELDKITKQSSTNKQGGNDEVVDHVLSNQLRFHNEQRTTYATYQHYLESGMRKELARINLPLAQYSEMYATVDLHNLFHFLRLRLDSHAQYEIQVYGQAIAELIKDQIPLAWKAFEDYQLNSVRLSGLEVEALRKIINLKDGMVDLIDQSFTNKREKEEFTAKLRKMI